MQLHALREVYSCCKIFTSANCTYYIVSFQKDDEVLLCAESNGSYTVVGDRLG